MKDSIKTFIETPMFFLVKLPVNIILVSLHASDK